MQRLIRGSSGSLPLVGCFVALLACSVDDSGTGTPNDGGGRVDGGATAPDLDVSRASDTEGDQASDEDLARPEPVCGDGRCSGGETVATCDQDCGPCRDLPGELTALEETLLNLPSDSWYELPDSRMRDACVPDSVGVRGATGCSAVVSAWNSGAYDVAHNRMIIWGGGHNDYHGNEIYAFGVRSGSWSRLTEPSTGNVTNQDPLPDGRPVSRHTYDGLEIIAHADALWAHGGSRASDGSSTGVTWTFDLDSAQWTQQASGGPGGLTNSSAYDFDSRLMFYRSAEDLHTYDLDRNQWTSAMNFGNAPEWPRYANSGNKTAAVDPVRHLFWSVGAGDILVWDIAVAALVTDEWVTSGGGDYTNVGAVGDRPGQRFESGGGDIYDAQAPGFDYDLAADELVAWSNRGGPYRLDLETRVWTRGTGEGAPTSRTSGGTFGRWRYVPDYNVFILVNDVDENVFFYKNTRCGR